MFIKNLFPLLFDEIQPNDKIHSYSVIDWWKLENLQFFCDWLMKFASFFHELLTKFVVLFCEQLTKFADFGLWPFYKIYNIKLKILSRTIEEHFFFFFLLLIDFVKFEQKKIIPRIPLICGIITCTYLQFACKNIFE